MAEFCKDCFRSKLLTIRENEIITDDRIIMFEDEGLCEGCGEIKPLVHYLKYDYFSEV